MKVFRPHSFMFVPTMSCQASCKYCFAIKGGKVMGRDTVDKAIDFIAQIAPDNEVIHITFHGGEPLLAGIGFYEYVVPKMLERFGDKIHFSIQSNLWAMDDQFAEFFKKYRFGIGTSIDGDEAICDSQRGEGYYAKSKAGQETLRRHGMGAGEICTFAAANSDKAAEVFNSSRKCYSIHGAVPSLGATPTGMEVSAEQMTRIFCDSYEAYKNDLSHGRISTIDSMARGCLDDTGHTCTFFDCLGVFAAIAPDGKVFTCQRFCGIDEYCVGNVVDGLTEEQILGSAAYAKLDAVESGKKAACGNCPHYNYCKGGCLYNTIVGNASKDPYCEAYRKVFDRILHDMAIEMGRVMLHESIDTPVLAMAGNKPHPFGKDCNSKQQEN